MGESDNGKTPRLKEVMNHPEPMRHGLLDGMSRERPEHKTDS